MGHQQLVPALSEPVVVGGILLRNLHERVNYWQQIDFCPRLTWKSLSSWAEVLHRFLSWVVTGADVCSFTPVS